MPNPGKLGRLPWPIKRELHNQLRDTVPGPQILTWLNGLHEVRTLLEAQWKGQDITPQNLSDYRGCAEYQKWLSSQTRLEESQERSQFVLGLASDAGLDLSDAADALTTSKILELMECGDTNEVIALTEVFARLRASSVARAGQSLREKEMANRIAKLDLDREKFQKQTVEAFLKFARTKEAQEILDNGKPKGVQMDLLHDLMFGKKPE